MLHSTVNFGKRMQLTPQLMISVTLIDNTSFMCTKTV